MGAPWRERTEEERREMVAEALEEMRAILNRPEVRAAIVAEEVEA